VLKTHNSTEANVFNIFLITSNQEAFSSANRKLIFEKIRNSFKKIEKQLYITICLMDYHQHKFNQN